MCAPLQSREIDPLGAGDTFKRGVSCTSTVHGTDLRDLPGTRETRAAAFSTTQSGGKLKLFRNPASWAEFFAKLHKPQAQVRFENSTHRLTPILFKVFQPTDFA